MVIPIGLRESHVVAGIYCVARIVGVDASVKKMLRVARLEDVQDEIQDFTTASASNQRKSTALHPNLSTWPFRWGTESLN